MPLQKLTASQLVNKAAAPANPEYVAFLRSLKPGEGGRTTVEAEGVGRQTIKTRLGKAADYAGVTIKFVRSPSDQVVFQVVARK
ncbi:MAG: hypothetical protein ACK2T6_10005 [Anaerolineae bacterium]|jgi:hypothetical protein